MTTKSYPPTPPFTDEQLKKELDDLIKDEDGCIGWNSHGIASSTEDRFEARIEALGFKTKPTILGDKGCWISTRKVAGRGRLYSTFDGWQPLTYRAMFATYSGEPFPPLPEDAEGHHHCKNPACIRPGTHHVTGPWDKETHTDIHRIEDNADTVFWRKDKDKSQ